MPIADGLTSTKMIRSYEKSHPQSTLSPRASYNGRVPIFAVSASLVERERNNYINAGFDGWIMKPIDFKRLNVLLAGIVEDSTRKECLYKPGHWEAGGWFHERQPDVFQADTKPSEDTPVQNPPPTGPEAPQPDRDGFSPEDPGSPTPTNADSQTPADATGTLHSLNEAAAALCGPDIEDRPIVDVSNQPHA